MRLKNRKGQFDVPVTDLIESQIDNAIENGILDFCEVIDFTMMANREIQIPNEIGAGVGSTVDCVLRFWNKIDDEENVPIKERQPIRVIINCNGGDLDETFIMYDAIRASKTPVHTIAIGSCYSGGFITFLAGHKRLCYPHATFLLHEGTGGYWNDATRMKNWSAFYDKQIKALKQIVIDRTNIDENFYNQINREDYWMMADEALEKGVVDEITKELAN